MIGRTLAHYTILESLGKGGMGEVFVAEDTRLKRKVALKVLPAEVTEDPDRLARFQREAETLAALNHPNIVTIHSVEEAEGVRFLTMELVEGLSLADLIPSRGLDREPLLKLAIPLANALGAAHERGIVHRDLKPANVMVGRDGRLKVLDFGIAKLVEEGSGAEQTPEAATLPAGLTSAGLIVGTVPYMSPEQVTGKTLDQRSDVFSLGILLHEMATGRRPFEGDSSAELVSSILRDVPGSVAEAKPDLPRHLGRIVGRCLEKEPERRYQTARDVALELEGLKRETEALSVATHPTPAPRRSRWPLLVGGTAALLLIAFLIALFLARTSPPLGGDLSNVAVLPFENLTGDPEQNYLSEGIAAGLIGQLSEVAGLHVVGRAEAWSRARRTSSSQEVGRQLGVGGLVEGEIQQAGDRLRVSVTLTDPVSGLVLWREHFEDSREKLFALQQDIAERLARVLAVPLSRAELERLARNPTKSLEAYEYFLKGQERLSAGRDSQVISEAVELFRQTVRLDPDFALAHAGLSEALWSDFLRNRERESLEEAEKHARRALELDPELLAARVALARIQRGTGRQEDSIATLEELLAEHPKPDQAQREIASAYEQLGEPEEAERWFRAAVALATDDWTNWNALGFFLARQGRYGEAREAFEQAAELAPPSASWPREQLAMAELAGDNFDAAVSAFEKLPRPIRDGRLANNIATAYFYSNRPDKWEQAERYYSTAVRLSPRHALRRANLADLYFELGRTEEARVGYRIAYELTTQELAENPNDPQLLMSQALYGAKAGQCEAVLPLTGELYAELPRTGPNLRDLAKVWAACDRREEALQALREAMAQGESSEMIRQDVEFQHLREDPAFLEILALESVAEAPGA